MAQRHQLTGDPGVKGHVDAALEIADAGERFCRPWGGESRDNAGPRTKDGVK